MLHGLRSMLTQFTRLSDTLTMSAQRQLEYNYSEKEYWQIEEFSTVKHEFWHGQIYAMAGATGTHNDIAGNVFASLHTQLRGLPCVPRSGDQRVKASTLQTYPDDVVACRPLQYDPNERHTLIDAVVLVEVLSRSTQKNDRNAKFDAYKQLPSLRHYLLIEQTPFHVEHHSVGENGDWHSEIFRAPGDIVGLSAIECQLNVGEIYEDIELAD